MESISIVHPAYNEASNIERVISDSLEYLAKRQGEVIVVDDGSQDETGSLIDRISQEYPDRVRVFHHPENLGYATALKTGFKAAKSDWVFYTDADGQFDVKEIDDLLRISKGADIVTGIRIHRQDPRLRIFAARVYNFIVRTIFGFKVRDIDCAFKLFRREVFDSIQIESSGFTVDTEIIAKAHRQGMVIREFGVTHLPRRSGKSTVRPGDVVKALIGIAKLYLRLKSEEKTLAEAPANTNGLDEMRRRSSGE